MPASRHDLSPAGAFNIPFLLVRKYADMLVGGAPQVALVTPHVPLQALVLPQVKAVLAVLVFL